MPGASKACTPYLLLTLGRAEDLYGMLSRRQLGSNLSHAALVKGGEVVPEFHAVGTIEELTSLKKVEMECYLGVGHILHVHPQPKPFY